MTGHTAIYFYQRDILRVEQVKEEFPNYSAKEVREHLKKTWDELNDDERDYYEDMSKESKANLPKKGKKKPKEAKKIPTTDEPEMRPKKAKSPFFHYLYDPVIRASVKDEHGVSGKDLTSLISAQWNALEDKQKWITASLSEKEELADNPVVVIKSSPKKKTLARKENRIDELEKKVIDLLKRVTLLEDKASDSDE